jgi:RimJ/RimL family protein N-acetyltransferase
MIAIRKIRETDAESFLNLCRKLDEETQFMMLESGERQTSIEEQTHQIREILQKENQMIFVAEADNRLVGYLAAYGGDFKRNRHSAHLVIGILQDFAGQRIGKKLFLELEHWAKQNNLHRLELTVMRHNERAINLYQKMGFEIEGVKKHSLLVNGKYVDEYYMAKLLS